jgi:hypothetical protein
MHVTFNKCTTRDENFRDSEFRHYFLIFADDDLFSRDPDPTQDSCVPRIEHGFKMESSTRTVARSVDKFKEQLLHSCRSADKSLETCKTKMYASFVIKLDGFWIGIIKYPETEELN